MEIEKKKMKVKKLVIKQCSECPFLIKSTADESFWCKYNKRYFNIALTIPDWCLLEDEEADLDDFISP